MNSTILRYMGTIYKITNTRNGKSYIGQTISNDNTKRFYFHIRGFGNRLIKQAVEKYGRDTFTFDILYQAVILELLDEYEIHAIRSYNTIAPNGYNLTHGGLGGNPSAETRKKNQQHNQQHRKEKGKNQELKARIAASRIALIESDKITRYRLAKDLDVSESQIGRIYNAVYAPSLDLLVKLADYFNVTTDHILGRK